MCFRDYVPGRLTCHLIRTKCSFPVRLVNRGARRALLAPRRWPAGASAQQLILLAFAGRVSLSAACRCNFLATGIPFWSATCDPALTRGFLSRAVRTAVRLSRLRCTTDRESERAPASPPGLRYSDESENEFRGKPRFWSSELRRRGRLVLRVAFPFPPPAPAPRPLRCTSSHWEFMGRWRFLFRAYYF